MPNKHTHDPPEFRQRMIELVRSGPNPLGAHAGVGAAAAGDPEFGRTS